MPRADFQAVGAPRQAGLLGPLHPARVNFHRGRDLGLVVVAEGEEVQGPQFHIEGVTFPRFTLRLPKPGFPEIGGGIRERAERDQRRSLRADRTDSASVGHRRLRTAQGAVRLVHRTQDARTGGEHPSPYGAPSSVRDELPGVADRVDGLDRGMRVGHRALRLTRGTREIEGFVEQLEIVDVIGTAGLGHRVPDRQRLLDVPQRRTGRTQLLGFVHGSQQGGQRGHEVLAFQAVVRQPGIGAATLREWTGSGPRTRRACGCVHPAADQRTRLPAATHV
jgi:hypothetical protein